jgi:hypothetical protein
MPPTEAAPSDSNAAARCRAYLLQCAASGEALVGNVAMAKRFGFVSTSGPAALIRRMQAANVIRIESDGRRRRARVPAADEAPWRPRPPGDGPAEPATGVPGFGEGCRWIDGDLRRGTARACGAPAEGWDFMVPGASRPLLRPDADLRSAEPIQRPEPVLGPAFGRARGASPAR